MRFVAAPGTVSPCCGDAGVPGFKGQRCDSGRAKAARRSPTDGSIETSVPGRSMRPPLGRTKVTWVCRRTGAGGRRCDALLPALLPRVPGVPMSHRQGPVQACCEYLQSGSATSLSDLFRCLTTLTVKKVFLTFKRNFLCFSLCPCPAIRYQHKDSGSLFTPSHQVSIYIGEIPLEPPLLRDEQPQLSQPLRAQQNSSHNP